jgi:hypothetical protein
MDRAMERAFWFALVVYLLMRGSAPRIRVAGPGAAIPGGRAIEVPVSA